MSATWTTSRLCEVVSSGPEGIACWFIDTDYNEESFFVRHAYFLGQQDPYKALKTTLKAEIDPEAWATLHLVQQLLKVPSLAGAEGNGSDPFGVRFLQRVMESPEKTRRSRLRKSRCIRNSSANCPA